MFKSLRKYVANKIYSEPSFNEDMFKYVNQLQDHISELYKFMTDYIKTVVDKNSEVKLILDHEIEIEQLKEELFLANKALLKSTENQADNTPKNDFGEFLLAAAPWFILIYFLLCTESSKEIVSNTLLFDILEEYYKAGKLDSWINNWMENN